MESKENKEIYNPKYVESLFDKMSESYERINILFSFGFTYFWRKAMIKKIKNQVNPTPKLIDLMTGMGETWDLIKIYFPKSTVTGLDISTGMLGRATKKNKEKFDNKIITTRQNVLENSLNANEYDLVLCAFGLKTFNEAQISILAKEVKRILKPNGSFGFVEISAPNNFILKIFYQIYLGKITPIITKLLLGDPVEYRMLWQYTSKFENAKKVEKIFNEEGLKVVYDKYFFGCASGIRGIKME